MECKTFDPDGVGVDNGTYFGLPFDPATAELVLVSAPWDVTVSYGAGAAYAPDAIIEASTQLDFHEPLAPGAWRRGIATALLQHAVRTARDAGFRLLEIGTGDIGAGQIALYERCGFVRCGIDEDYFRKHYPAPIFENGVECRHMVRLRMEFM